MRKEGKKGEKLQKLWRRENNLIFFVRSVQRYAEKSDGLLKKKTVDMFEQEEQLEPSDPGNLKAPRTNLFGKKLGVNLKKNITRGENPGKALKSGWGVCQCPVEQGVKKVNRIREGN